jgi:hypothetical protein
MCEPRRWVVSLLFLKSTLGAFGERITQCGLDALIFLGPHRFGTLIGVWATTGAKAFDEVYEAVLRYNLKAGLVTNIFMSRVPLVEVLLNFIKLNRWLVVCNEQLPC